MFSKKIMLLLPLMAGCQTDAFLNNPDEVSEVREVESPYVEGSEAEVVLPREEVAPDVAEGIMKDSGVRLGAMELPSIFETSLEVPKEEQKNEKEAVEVIKIGEEKIRVLDENMGAVAPEDVKKLRSQR
jgi:hypothetical protein